MRNPAYRAALLLFAAALPFISGKAGIEAGEINEGTLYESGSEITGLKEEAEAAEESGQSAAYGVETEPDSAAENSDRGGTGAFENSGRSGSGADESPGQGGTGAFENSGRGGTGADENPDRSGTGVAENICIRDGYPKVDGLVYDHSMALHHADQFCVDYYLGGCKVITVEGTGTYLLLPDAAEGAGAFADLDRAVKWAEDNDVTVIHTPPSHIYLAATSAMDFFDALNELDSVRLSCLEEGKWYNEAANEAMSAGRILFAGKYSAPDYELILSEGCDLALESTMIYHKPEIIEMLERFQIPVLVEHSSYEKDPLGRAEWIRFYGALLGAEDKADAVFETMEEKVEKVLEAEAERGQDSEYEKPEEKTVAFFSLTSQGLVTVRKSGDYLPVMIRMAGGRYAFDDLAKKDENHLATVNLQMEEFYAGAVDADYLIYNSTIAGELDSVSELIDKAPLLSDFKAVREGHVWCTRQSLFQEPTGLADLILDIYRMLHDSEEEGYVKENYRYLYPLDIY